jgi:hypothetical protein
MGRLDIQNRLATKDRMVQLGLNVDAYCVLSRSRLESREHLFFQCPWTGAFIFFYK